MAASGGYNYRDGGQRGALRVDRPLSVNSNPKSSVKSKSLPGSGPRRNSTGSTGGGGGSAGAAAAKNDNTGVLGRVRVAVRLRPHNDEEMVADADFADCVELQPELKRLKLRKNNWDTDTYEFDEVLTEFASQKRVYEVVAKPVVESVLDGYNGTVMAYGQTGTGKTYTLGRLGEEDTAARGIMVRAMEDILADVSLESDSLSVSYLQLYMETIQDLLDPANDNISIVEDPKTGDVSVPGASLVEIRDQQSFVELLRLGEAHRFATNTKLNTESSRSHAILMVNVKKSVKGRDSALSSQNGNNSHVVKSLKAPVVRKSKLVVVDLAGSERIDKSGSEGHTLEEAKSINLSLSALGKCINALAENSSHVPVRDSKLTRLLRDSFGGTARTSLVITIGPSPRHRGETASTIMFGQRAMKVENMLKLKEEFDYKSLARRLDIQLDKIIAEHERQQKVFEDEMERISIQAENRVSDVERNYADALEKERLKYQKDYMESIKKLEEQLVITQKKHGSEKITNGHEDNGSNVTSSKESCRLHVEEIDDLTKLLQKETMLRKAAEEEVQNLKSQLTQWKRSEAAGNSEILKLRKMLEDEEHQKEKLEGEIARLHSQLLQLSFEADETSQQLDRSGPGKIGGLESLMTQVRQPQLKDSGNGEKASIAKLFEQVGLHKILSLLEAEDNDVRIHAVKVVANLAAEETNQERIVEAGGLTSLLMLLENSEDETIHRVAAGAIANLAMNETNQELIMTQGGISLLSMTAAHGKDPQTLRMVAGAIANLCGNDKLQNKLRGEGGIKALLGMVRCGHPDVLAQVARGIANFAKCESRASTQGTKTGKSLLIEDGALAVLISPNFRSPNDAQFPKVGFLRLPIMSSEELGLVRTQNGLNSPLVFQDENLRFNCGAPQQRRVGDAGPKTRELTGFIDDRFFAPQSSDFRRSMYSENPDRRDQAQPRNWNSNGADTTPSAEGSDEDDDDDEDDDEGDGGLVGVESRNKGIAGNNGSNGEDKMGNGKVKHHHQQHHSSFGGTLIVGSSRQVLVKEHSTGQQIVNSNTRASSSDNHSNAQQGRLGNYHNAVTVAEPDGDMYYSQYLQGSEGSGSAPKDLVVENGCGFSGRKDVMNSSESGDSLRAILSDPVTGALMDDAVILPCGHSFGGGGIQHVIRMKACYSCSLSISEDSIAPNLSLRAAVQAFQREEELQFYRSSKRRRERFDQEKGGCGDLVFVDSPRGRGVQFPFAVTDRVIIKGNKRTPQRFVGREAVVTTQCLNGWYVVKTLDNAESVKLQYRSLAKVSDDPTSKPMSSKMAPNWL